MSWQEAARLTFQSHLRSRWVYAWLALTLAAPLHAFAHSALAQAGLRPYGFGRVDFAPFPTVQGLLGLLLAGMLLARVLLSFRGAWLTEPESAAQRIPGYFAGTLAAVAVGLLPWALVDVGFALVHDGLGRVWLPILASYVGTLLALGAWIALLLLACVRVDDVEGRWAAGFLGLGVLSVIVPAIATLSVAFGSPSDDGFGNEIPPWTLAVDALSPWRLHLLFVESWPRGSDPTGYADAFPLLFHPLTFAALLLVWTAAPLALATRIQMRRDLGSPAPEVAP